ncbi:MAG: hypothetical protein EPO13_07635 [Actinomycetota bacterium]|nr:MAG: hypothetical protein EPO13_07635 [Actinomycetota bacterium]
MYCNDFLVDDFLAQLEGGQFDEIRRREQTEREGKGDLSVGLGSMLRAGGGVSRTSTEEAEAVVRQVRASKFERLYRLLLDSNDLVEVDETLDEERWSDFQRGSIVSIDSKVVVPQMARIFGDPSGLIAFLSLIKQMDPSAITEEAEAAFSAITALSQGGVLGSSLTAVANPPGSPYRLVMRLDRRFILDDAALDGEATVVGKVARRLRETDRELTLDIPGLSLMDVEDRRKMFEGADSEPFSIQGPGAVLVPVAVFR